MSNLGMDFLRWFILTHKMCFEHYCMLFFFHFNLKVLQMCVCVSEACVHCESTLSSFWCEKTHITVFCQVTRYRNKQKIIAISVGNVRTNLSRREIRCPEEKRPLDGSKQQQHLCLKSTNKHIYSQFCSVFFMVFEKAQLTESTSHSFFI